MKLSLCEVERGNSIKMDRLLRYYTYTSSSYRCCLSNRQFFYDTFILYSRDNESSRLTIKARETEYHRGFAEHLRPRVVNMYLYSSQSVLHVSKLHMDTFSCSIIKSHGLFSGVSRSTRVARSFR